MAEPIHIHCDTAQTRYTETLDAAADLHQQLHPFIASTAKHTRFGLLLADYLYPLPALAQALFELINMPMLGYTCTAQFAEQQGFIEGGVTLLILSAEDLEISIHTTDHDTSVESAVQRLLPKNQSPSLAIMVSDIVAPGLRGEAILRHLRPQLPKQMVLVGGMASADLSDADTAIVALNEQGEALVDTIGTAILYIHNRLNITPFASSGWQPYSLPGKITKASEHWIEEVNGMPAADYFENHQYIGTIPRPRHPMVITDSQGRFVSMRGTHGETNEAGAVRYLGQVPQGHRIQQAFITRESLLKDLYTDCETALARSGLPKAKLVLVFSCDDRRKHLGLKAQSEYQQLKDIFGDAVLVGSYTFGEIGQAEHDTQCEFHNNVAAGVIIS